MSSPSVVVLVVQWIAGALAVGRWLAWKREAWAAEEHSKFLRGVIRDQLQAYQAMRDRTERAEKALAARSAGVVQTPVVDTTSRFVATPETPDVLGRKTE